MQTSRGIRRPSYTLVTPANHYPSRLPAFGDAPVVKLVTPRLAPSQIGEYLVTLPAGAFPVPAGFETFVYGLDGDASIDEIPLGPSGFAYRPADDAYELRAGAAGARLLMIKRRYEPYGDLPAPGALSGHRDDEPFADTDVRDSAAGSCCRSPTPRSTST